MSGKSTNLAGQGRKDRLIQQKVHDPYRSQQKLPEPTLCPKCNAVYSSGRWQWLHDIAKPANETVCPACRRIDEKVPAGLLSMQGEFLAEHKDEIMHLLHNKAEAEKSHHPLKRIMSIEEHADGSILASFTDTHLPRDIGEALSHAYQGKLDIHYAEDEDLTRVSWKR